METSITISVTKDELDRIHKTFNELKMFLNVNKKHLYAKALLWIVESRKIRSEFIKYIQNEKAKIIKELLNE
jgi:hypothetical protein